MTAPRKRYTQADMDRHDRERDAEKEISAIAEFVQAHTGQHERLDSRLDSMDVLLLQLQQALLKTVLLEDSDDRKEVKPMVHWWRKRREASGDREAFLSGWRLWAGAVAVALTILIQVLNFFGIAPHVPTAAP